MKKVPVKDISASELSALNEFAAQFRSVQPQLVKLGKEARAVHQATVEAPVWAVAETQQQGSKVELPKDPWRIGAPKVNYVDHIEGDPGESGDETT